MQTAAFRLAATVFGLAALPTGSSQPATAVDTPLSETRTAPGVHLPIVKERFYVMSGAARPLLFWIGRDDIGLARIVWRRRDDGARGYELLVGTDPARAPRAINRWGFISEEVLGSRGSMLAIMTGSHETSYERERADAARDAANGDFRMIRSRMQDGQVEWQLAQARTPAALTVHQVSGALDLVPPPTGGLARRRTVSSAVRSGFLVAMADLVDATVVAARGKSGRLPAAAPALQYVFGEQTYEVRLRAVEPVSVSYAGGRIQAARTSFETCALRSGARTRFELTIGTTGDTAGIPLSIEWQPRWWLRVRLALEDPR
jgi:hypothetical protein